MSCIKILFAVPKLPTKKQPGLKKKPLQALYVNQRLY